MWRRISQLLVTWKTYWWQPVSFFWGIPFISIIRIIFLCLPSPFNFRRIPIRWGQTPPHRAHSTPLSAYWIWAAECFRRLAVILTFAHPGCATVSITAVFIIRGPRCITVEVVPVFPSVIIIIPLLSWISVTIVPPVTVVRSLWIHPFTFMAEKKRKKRGYVVSCVPFTSVLHHYSVERPNEDPFGKVQQIFTHILLLIPYNSKKRKSKKAHSITDPPQLLTVILWWMSTTHS